MSIEKKSLISNRAVAKKANVTKPSATTISTSKLSSTLTRSKVASGKVAVTMSRPRIGGANHLAVSMAKPMTRAMVGMKVKV